jgi:phosphate transport system permease protein
MNSKRGMFTREYLWRSIVTMCGLFVIVITLGIGGFLVYKGSGTFLKFHHSIGEFLFSSDWAPVDNMEGGGSVGTLIFIPFLKPLAYIVQEISPGDVQRQIATPFALGSAIFMTEIAPKFGEKFYRPVIQIFAGIPSVVYGWVGLTVLVPFIRDIFHRQVGHSILAAGLVLAIMIFPTITSVAADAIRAVPKDYRMGAYGMGSTRWQTIYKIVLPASASGIFSGIILGLARAFGEALAVAMVIGQTTALPESIFSTTKSLTTEITAQMGNAMEGGETKTALWTLALLLFLISLLFIFLIHILSRKKPEDAGAKAVSKKSALTSAKQD